jgi:hypothetical protein
VSHKVRKATARWDAGYFATFSVDGGSDFFIAAPLEIILDILHLLKCGRCFFRITMDHQLSFKIDRVQ